MVANGPPDRDGLRVGPGSDHDRPRSAGRWSDDRTRNGAAHRFGAGPGDHSGSAVEPDYVEPDQVDRGEVDGGYVDRWRR